MGPSVVSALKFGASSPMRTDIRRPSQNLSDRSFYPTARLPRKRWRSARRRLLPRAGRGRTSPDGHDAVPALGLDVDVEKVEEAAGGVAHDVVEGFRMVVERRQR